MLRAVLITIFYSFLFSSTHAVEYEKNCGCEQMHKERYFERLLKRIQSPTNYSPYKCAPQLTLMNDVKPIKDEDFDFIPGGLNGPYIVDESSVPIECIVQSAKRMKGLTKNHRFQVCSYNDEYTGQRINNPVRAQCNGKIKSFKAGPSCITENYAKGMWYAFHESARCVGISAREVFPLFNRESGFLHNVFSPTGPRCAGQLSNAAIVDVNERFNDLGRSTYNISSNLETLKFSNIAKRCPKLIRPDTINELEEERGFNEDIFRPIDIYKGRSLNSEGACRVTENPFSCFVYSLIFLRKAELEIEADLSDIGSVFLGKTKDGDDMFHKDEFTLKNFQRVVNKKERLREYRSIDFKKVSIFKEPVKIAQLVTFWSYNGGNSIYKILLPEFLENLRYQIDRNDPNDRDNQNLRKVVAAGGLDISYFQREFKRYISKNYRWFGKGNASETQKIRRIDEVSEYVDDIWKSYRDRLSIIPNSARRCACFSGAPDKELHCE